MKKSLARFSLRQTISTWKMHPNNYATTTKNRSTHNTKIIAHMMQVVSRFLQMHIWSCTRGRGKKNFEKFLIFHGSSCCCVHGRKQHFFHFFDALFLSLLCCCASNNSFPVEKIRDERNWWKFPIRAIRLLKVKRVNFNAIIPRIPHERLYFLQA